MMNTSIVCNVSMIVVDDTVAAGLGLCEGCVNGHQVQQMLLGTVTQVFKSNLKNKKRILFKVCKNKIRKIIFSNIDFVK